LCTRSEHYDGRLGEPLLVAKLLEYLEPRPARHHHVEHDQVRLEAARELDGLVAVPSLDDVVALRGERRADESPENLLVVADENPCRYG
jgi:hypothetical protein